MNTTTKTYDHYVRLSLLVTVSAAYATILAIALTNAL